MAKRNHHVNEAGQIDERIPSSSFRKRRARVGVDEDRRDADIDFKVESACVKIVRKTM